MKAKYLKVLLKKREERTLMDLVNLIEFWRLSDSQEFKYGLHLNSHFEKMYGIKLI